MPDGKTNGTLGGDESILLCCAHAPTARQAEHSEKSETKPDNNHTVNRERTIAERTPCSGRSTQDDIHSGGYSPTGAVGEVISTDVSRGVKILRKDIGVLVGIDNRGFRMVIHHYRVRRQLAVCHDERIREAEASSASGIVRVWATAVMKFESPTHRGTT